MKTLLIKNGTVVTLDENQRVIEGGEVLIEGSSIVAVGHQFETKHKVDHIIDARGGVIMPGLINVHHHLYSTFARGFACPGEPAKKLPGNPGASVVAAGSRAESG